MTKKPNISMSVIRRLPRYYRFLRDLKISGVPRISSRELSKRMNITASQIRQDFNCFGEFGLQGYGYNVELLFSEICGILGLGAGHKTILIGAGNLGKAIATHMDFAGCGFRLAAIFDNNEFLAGKKVMNIPILHVDELRQFCQKETPVVAILCIPPNDVRELVDTLIALGVKGFWNFTHTDLDSESENILVENVHLSDSMMTLCYRMQQAKAQQE